MWQNKQIFFFRLLIVILPCIEGATRLNEYIRHYETLDYDTLGVHDQHLRVRRSLDEEDNDGVTLAFNAHKKAFRLRLKRDTSVFSSGFYLESDNDAIVNSPDTSHIYHGHVEGVANSHVHGSIQDGVFDGKIETPDGTYYIERAHKYTLPSTNESLHSVIYADHDISDPYEHLREGHAKGCGITDEVMDWMQSIQNAADLPEELKHPKSKPLQKQGPTAEALKANYHMFHDHGGSFSKYSREANGASGVRESSTENSMPFRVDGGGRGRRSSPGTPQRTTCPLSIQTDPLLWKHIVEQMGTTDEAKIREEILSLIAQHVKEVNRIYSNTPFRGKMNYNNVRFEVQRVKIDTDKACKPDHKGDPNLFCLENIDVSNFLNLHSLSDHDAFCLAYVFTYRDFTGGTLGLAWVASASGASGGVCEKYKTYTETIQGVYQSTKRSLNTGIITFVNYNSRVPPKVSQLTLAHEIGHNFGSPHDYPSRCRPGGVDGNYIMFASATSGDRPNNSQFSECSKNNISSVLDAIIHDHKKNNCFIATNGTFCGNKIVEDGEECDCGFDESECMEKCCYPRRITPEMKSRDPNAEACKRRPGKVCSPSEGPCCDSTCNFVNINRRVSCKSTTECSQESFCSGSTARCPEPTHKQELTPCNNGTQVCQKGECRGSICLKFGLSECFLSSADKSVDKRKLCELACLDGDRCRSTSDLHIQGLTPGLSLRPGAPCDNFQGYCDVFLKCRAVDAEGPLARLKNLLFNKETLLNIAQWVTEYWWGVLLMGVGFIILMGLFIKCCAVHTPSSNPKKPPARRIGDTLRRPMNTLRRHRQQHYRRPATASASSNGSHPSSGGGGGHSNSGQQNGVHPNSGHPNGGPHVGAPPPYSASAAGPSAPTRPPTAPHHGFGEGRGPNRNKGGNQGSSRTAGAHPYNNGGYPKPEARHQQHRV